MQGVRLKNLLKSITVCQSNKNWIKGNHKKTVTYVLNKVDLWVFSEDRFHLKLLINLHTNDRARIIMHLGQVGTHQPLRDPRNSTNNNCNSNYYYYYYYFMCR